MVKVYSAVLSTELHGTLVLCSYCISQELDNLLGGDLKNFIHSIFLR